MPGGVPKTPRSNKPVFDSPARNELIAKLSLHDSAPQTSATNTSIKPTLSGMPYEIKQNIVLCVNDMDQDDWFEDDSDVEEVDDEEFREDPKIITRSQAKLQVAEEEESGEDARPGSSHGPSPRPLKSIHALSLVNRQFYELCRPFIWEMLDLEGYTISKLEHVLNEILPRQSHYVRTIWWRVSHAELEEFEDGFMHLTEAEMAEQWDEEARSSLLLHILEACPRLASLDIDLCAVPVDNDGNWGETLSPMQKFLTPVSQLRSLRRLGLTAPSGRKAFSESFLVRLIRDLGELESFTCDHVDATAPKSAGPCQSPLGIHLASLASLVHLDLTKVESLDLSWSKLEWRGALRELALDECPRVSIEALHAFVERFAGSLEKLELDTVPIESNVAWPAAARYVFKLPALVELSVCNYLDTQFLRAFSECKKLRLLELGEGAVGGYNELEELIKDSLWPKLERLRILNDMALLSDAEIEALELYCLTRGITVEVELDEEDEDVYTISEGASELEDLQDEWDSDDEDGDDEDDDE